MKQLPRQKLASPRSESQHSERLFSVLPQEHVPALWLPLQVEKGPALSQQATPPNMSALRLLSKLFYGQLSGLRLGVTWQGGEGTACRLLPTER